jgi:hypothetical protein
MYKILMVPALLASASFAQTPTTSSSVAPEKQHRRGLIRHAVNNPVTVSVKNKTVAAFKGIRALSEKIRLY